MTLAIIGRNTKYKAPLLCNIDSYDPKPDEEVLIAVMDIDFRKKMIKALLAKNAKIGTFIHHNVVIPENISIGEGNLVGPFCMLRNMQL